MITFSIQNVFIIKLTHCRQEHKINRKEKFSKGGMIKQLVDTSLDKYFDHIFNKMKKREYTGGSDFKVLKRTDEGATALEVNKIKLNIGTIVYHRYLARRKIATPVTIIKAMENNDPNINKEKWKKIVNTTVEFYENPGNHETMLLEPNVDRLAVIVRGTLKKQ